MRMCIRLLFASVVLLTSITGFADTLTLMSSVRLSAPIWIANSASADGKRVVVQLRASDNHPSGFQVIDTSDIRRPKVMGFVPLPNYEEIALSGGYGKYEDIALSRDGKLALVVIATEKEKFREETDHEVIELDLIDANNPREVWRKKLSARRVSLSADASAYAYSNLSKTNPKIWETTVIFVTNTQNPITFKENEYSFGDMQLSSHAKFLVFNDHYQLKVWDLSSSPPNLYQQVTSGLQRHECIGAVLENGYVVVNDFRFSRLGVYELSKGMPRVSTLAYDGIGYCDPINPDASDNKFAYLPVGLQIDFQNPKNPSMGDIWHTKDGTYPIALANETLFAYVSNIKAPQLEVYRIDTDHPTSTIWKTLAGKYAAIMETYNADLRSKKPSPYIQATKLFNEAGILTILDSPDVDIPHQQAAAILNDYGFLAIRSNSPAALIERTLERAIDLDPTRRIAYLNLADFLKDNASKSDKVKKYYRTYLSLGGKPTANINQFLKGDPALKILNDFCAGIADFAKAGYLGELISSSGTNVLVNGKKLDLVFTTAFSGSPVYFAYDSATDFPSESPNPPPGADEPERGTQLGLLTYRNESHILYYKDLSHPVSSISLSNGSTCKF